MDKLPVKINPDRLVTAVVEIRYESSLEHEFCLGILHQVLIQEFTLVAKEGPKDEMASNVELNEVNALFRVSTDPVYIDNNIKLSVRQGSFVFNIYKGYPGWAAYLESLKKALSLIGSSGIEFNFQRVGIRFISQYEDLDLTDVTKFNFGFGFPENKSKNFSFRNEFDYKGSLAVISIGNYIGAVEKPEKGGKVKVPVSQIDIDCIQVIELNEVGDKLISVIDQGHYLQKEIFFNLLRPEFLDKLNPVYDDK